MTYGSHLTVLHGTCASHQTLPSIAPFLNEFHFQSFDMTNSLFFRINFYSLHVQWLFTHVWCYFGNELLGENSSIWNFCSFLGDFYDQISFFKKIGKYFYLEISQFWMIGWDFLRSTSQPLFLCVCNECSGFELPN